MLQKIYAVYAISTLILTGVICAILLLPGIFLIIERWRLIYNQTIISGWGRVWAFIAGIRYEVLNRPSEKDTVVFVFNHDSSLDPATIYAVINRPFRTLAKKELARIPIYNFIVKASCVLIDRSSNESRKKGYQKMESLLRKGESIMIFPEGTKNRTPGPLKSFYPGAFRLAIEAGVPVQPVVSLNSRKLLPGAKMGKIRPGKITVKWLPPVSTENWSPDQADELKQLVFDQMKAAMENG